VVDIRQIGFSVWAFILVAGTLDDASANKMRRSVCACVRDGGEPSPSVVGVSE